MALTDDFYDVQAALKGKPAAAPFQRIMTRLDTLEVENEAQQKKIAELEAAVKVLKTP